MRTFFPTNNVITRVIKLSPLLTVLPLKVKTTKSSSVKNESLLSHKLRRFGENLAMLVRSMRGKICLALKKRGLLCVFATEYTYLLKTLSDVKIMKNSEKKQKYFLPLCSKYLSSSEMKLLVKLWELLLCFSRLKRAEM